MTYARRRILVSAFQVTKRADGGLESATRIFEALSDKHDWSFLTTQDSDFTARWRHRGAKVILTPFGERLPALARPAAYALWGSKILRAALSLRVDCVHANDTRAYIAASLPARMLRLPIVLTVRDTKEPGDTYGRHWRWAGKQCRFIVTLSEEMGQTIRNAVRARPHKLRTIHSIVDLVRFAPPTAEERAHCRARLGIPDQELALGCVGAVSDKKDQLGLVERVIPALRASVPHVRLHVFGDFDPATDAYCAQCVAMVERLGLQRTVVFHGHIPDMAASLKALDAIVIGARNEGLARAMIEGMACGVPIVSFSVCSAREMLGDTGAGVVVPAGDHFTLAKELIRFCANPSDRADMGKRARFVAEQRFDAAQISAKYLQLYDEAIGTARVSSS